MKEYTFTLPVTGTEDYLVKAETFEEAVEILRNGGDYTKVGDDIDLEHVPFSCIESMKDYATGDTE